MAQAARQNREGDAHRALFPSAAAAKYSLNTALEFNTAEGGRYKGDGVGGGFTGRPGDIFIIDDPTKNHKEALPPTFKQSHWDWFVSSDMTRMSGAQRHDCHGHSLGRG